MSRPIALALAWVLACASVASAQTISTQVTFTSSQFDIRCVDPAGTAYALNLPRGTSEIWASTDNARTFTFRGRLPAGTDFKTMTTLRDGTLLADAQTGTQFGIVRSTDHGATWTRVLELGQYRLLTPHSIEEFGSTVYLAEYQAFSAGAVPVRLWASTNGGATWAVRQTFQGHRHAHGVRADAAGNLWIFFGDSGTAAGVYRSTDGGATFTPVLLGQEGRVNDAVFVGSDILFGQDIPALPPQPSIARLTPGGTLTKLAPLPGPSYSIHQIGAGYLLGETREPNGDVFAPGDVRAHLFGSPDGVKWVELASYPRIDATDYARADVYWVLPSGEAVLNLRHVTTLPNGGRGFQLLRVTITPAAPAGGTSFADNFDACTTTTSLGPNWDIAGTWYCKVGRARGETAGGVALARTADLQDTEVAALVQLNTSDLSGLVARASGGAYYAARLVRAGRIEVIRVQPGSVQVLGSVGVTVADTTSYRLRLRVTGTNPARFEVIRDGVSVLTTTDPNTSSLASGRAGLLHGTGFRTQYDDFSVTGTPPVVAPAAFSDNFDACTSTTDLGPNWTISGIWYCKVGRARGETNAGLALVRPALTANQLVSSLVQLNGTADGSGVVARAAAGHFYLARILRAGRIEIVRVDNGAITVLGTTPGPISVDVSVVVGLQVTGTTTVQLIATIAGKPVLTATDSTANRLTSGSAGLFSAGASGAFFRTQYDNFSVRTP